MELSISKDNALAIALAVVVVFWVVVLIIPFKVFYNKNLGQFLCFVS